MAKSYKCGPIRFFVCDETAQHSTSSHSSSQSSGSAASAGPAGTAAAGASSSTKQSSSNSASTSAGNRAGGGASSAGGGGGDADGKSPPQIYPWMKRVHLGQSKSSFFIHFNVIATFYLSDLTSSFL